MALSASAACASCVAFHSSRTRHVKVQPIGSSVHLDPHGSATVSYLQCQTCGQLWKRSRDSGPGGRDSKYSALGPHLDDREPGR